MTTVLIIDDDPLIAALIQAVMPAWQIVAAPDGLAGLDLLRQWLAERRSCDLVVLDISMPGLDGYDTCIAIRALDPQLPIVPFTQIRDDPRLPRYMQELHCAPPITKGIHPQQLATRLRAAAEHCVTPIPTTAVFERLQQKAADAERAARAQRTATQPLLIFASSLVQRLGIQHVLEGIAGLPVQIAPYDDASLLLAEAVAISPIIVAPFVDARAALEHGHPRGWSLLLLASSIREVTGQLGALQDDSQSSVLGVVLADQLLLQQLPAALRALANNQSYIDPLLRRENAPRLAGLIVEHKLMPEVTPRLSELLICDLLGWGAMAIAEQFHVAPVTIETYSSRIVERLGIPRDAARQLIEQRMLGDAHFLAVAREELGRPEA